MTKIGFTFSLLALVFALPGLVGGQGTPQATRDPQAIAILAQSLAVAGGPTGITSIRDFTGSGTITYFWAGEEVQGNVTVKGRGTGQFRLDATLPNGVRSVAVNNDTGFVKEPDGTKRQIPYHNVANFGNLTFPTRFINTAVQDASISLVYVGLETRSGSQVHHIRTQKEFASDADPSGILTKLTRRDFLIDSTTFQVLSTLDAMHPVGASTIDYPREVQFSDYRSVNGVLVPFSIVEVATGQRTYLIQLNQVAFNTGLQDSDFSQ